ncbi:uncharacterized protein LOC134683914 isoform X2 [Mytilus trossulus]|uniref:uncharacterized protein LOC134683914 isoform X2 n=1 Tax=Mytilus trossulus TaxID=6551 RepID=UPI0030073FDA
MELNLRNCLTNSINYVLLKEIGVYTKQRKCLSGHGFYFRGNYLKRDSEKVVKAEKRGGKKMKHTLPLTFSVNYA